MCNWYNIPFSTFYPQSRPALLNKVAGNNWNSGSWQKYGPGGFRAFNETLGPEVCQRPGLFRHPTGEPDSIESRTKPPLIFFQTAPSSTSATGTSGLRSSPCTSSPAPLPWPFASTTSPSPPATGPSSGPTVRLEQGFSRTISSPRAQNEGISPKEAPAP